MFYRTQIKSVTDFGVVDMAGKKLRFMGYLPVKAGDWVFTDGTFIFGNVPPRGSPATFGEDPAGVPVLSNDLRGYFSRNGSFKNYPVKQDTWLVNSDKKFAHGSEDNVIDAELADDGSLLTVEKNKQEFLEIDESIDCIFKYSAYQHDMYSMHEEFKGGDILLPDISANDADCFRFDDDLFKDCEIIIKKDTKVMETFYLSELCATCEEDAMSFVTVIGGFVSRESLEVRIGDHIKSRAILKNFKIFPDGKWQALILCEVWTERGVSYETHKRQKSVEYFGTYDVRETRINGTTTFNEVITTISITQHPEPILSTAYASTLAKCLYLFKINSDGETILIRKSYIAYPLYLRQRKIEVTSAFTPSTNLTSPNDFPYIRVGDSTSLFWIGNLTYWATGAGFSPEWYNGQLRYCSYHSYYFHWGEYNHQRIYQYLSNVCNSATTFIYDSSVIPQLPFIYNSEQLVHGDSLTFPVQDDFQAKFTNAQDDINKWTLGGIVDAQNQPIIGAFLPDETDAHTWNMGCASLKGGSYLFGTHDKALYKIDRDGNSELVGDKLKNFRLRELKKISKSRR